MPFQLNSGRDALPLPGAVLTGFSAEAGVTVTAGWALIMQEAAVDFPAMLVSKLGANYFRKKLLSGIRPLQNQ
jgi:hypothetical protein